MPDKIPIATPGSQMDQPYPEDGKITQIIWEWCAGDRNAFNRLFSKTYEELHRVARRLLRNSPVQESLPATALINELYLRFKEKPKAQFANRKQFFGFAATVLRNILVDFARAKMRAKRGGGVQAIAFEDMDRIGKDAGDLSKILSVHEAMIAFEAVDKRQAKIMELRYFGGFTTEEIATALDISSPTVFRELATAKLWLARHLKKRRLPRLGSDGSYSNGSAS